MSDADAVQLRHAAPAALVLLPDHRARRPRRHLRRDQGQRPAVEVRRRPRQRLDPRARHGRHIKGTNGKSQGVVPFLKVANDTAVAVNQGGKRKGAVCAYLETWHVDVEEFLELRKNTGDDRRRTHDMNTANWIPDLFMQRVVEDGEWTLFSPSETADLHDLVGEAFAKRYAEYERRPRAARSSNFKKIRAVDLWRKMLAMLFETGHPWITFKDPCNLRSPQQPRGRGAQLQPVHRDYAEHQGRPRDRRLQPGFGQPRRARDRRWRAGSAQARAHRQHRDAHARQRDRLQLLQRAAGAQLQPAPPPGRPRHHGLPGRALRDAPALRERGRGGQFADTSMEAVSYFAIQASTELAAERGRYASFEGSLWSQGILPIDSIDRLARARGSTCSRTRSRTLDWDALRERVQTVGMRNSNTMAIAPTATISNICGVSQSIEPTYQNLYVKSNLSGEFTVSTSTWSTT
jgi:ribonucleoside-diphosphate reductase alpha chain